MSTCPGVALAAAVSVKGTLAEVVPVMFTTPVVEAVTPFGSGVPKAIATLPRNPLAGVTLKVPLTEPPSKVLSEGSEVTPNVASPKFVVELLVPWPDCDDVVLPLVVLFVPGTDNMPGEPSCPTTPLINHLLVVVFRLSVKFTDPVEYLNGVPIVAGGVGLGVMLNVMLT